MKHILFTILILTMTSPVFAQQNTMTECRHGEQLRVIEVIYPNDSPVPCEVTYTKESGTEVLWRAMGEVGYCEEKAANLVAKQRGWGWQCEDIDVTQPQ